MSKTVSPREKTKWDTVSSALAEMPLSVKEYMESSNFKEITPCDVNFTDWRFRRCSSFNLKILVLTSLQKIGSCIP